MNYKPKFRPRGGPLTAFYSTNCGGKQENCPGYIYEKGKFYFVDDQKVCEMCALKMGRVCAQCLGVKPKEFPYCWHCASKNNILGIPPKGYER